MYFGDKHETNIDDEFNQENNILSGILKMLSKYKLFVIVGLFLIVIVLMIILFVNKKVINYLDLNGEEVITLYQGTDYIEPGFKAYNSKDEDLNSQVIIKSTLDTDEVGEYEITYTLGELIETRRVVVIAKPEEYTYIYLNTVNNSVNVYLKVGDKYTEPGYQVFSGSGVTGQVKVTGTVDTSKKGNYKLTYSVVDANNVMISTTRTVIVMDTEISLSLNNEKYTNDNVTINVGIIDNYFDYIILPNNTKVTSSTYAYNVDENGKYTFTVYNTKGVSKQASIEVKNIDKIAPTGSCVVTHNVSGSVITIKASDTNGISKYVYNGIEYNNGTITLNKHIEDSKISVSFYDNAGNVGKAECAVPEVPNFSSSSSKNSSSSSSSSSNNKPSNSSSIKTTYVDVSDLSCTIVYGTSTVTNKIAVNVKIADEFHDILASVCNYVNSTPYLDKLQHAGAYVNREIAEHDYHSKGTAIDLNNLWSYTYNGKTYKPYSSQGTWTWTSYNKFVCEVCGGKEDCQYNVNYIIYNRYFKPKGWCWGGNYSPKYFDPMHFEKRDDECPVANRGQLSCD